VPLVADTLVASGTGIEYAASVNQATFLCAAGPAPITLSSKSVKLIAVLVPLPTGKSSQNLVSAGFTISS
jgi:hypothetical protein